jgi:hypothetical protein
VAKRRISHAVHDENEALRTRAARVLGWSVSDARSQSLAALRELVRGKDGELADDISRAIRTGNVVVGRPKSSPLAKKMSQDDMLRAMGYTEAQIRNFKGG